MPWLRFVLLISVLTITSGYKFRCWIFCTEQTAIQNDYTDQRDQCREYAQLKQETMAHNSVDAGDDKTHKSQLVSLFSECMARSGWSVPDGKSEAKGEGKAAAVVAAGAATAATTQSAVSGGTSVASTDHADDTKAWLARLSDCDFARQAASASHISAARAKACDLECASRLKAAPGAPRPAACPSAPSPDLSVGNEKN